MPGKSVLIIANAFPPVGGVGVLRIASFARYLREMGWDVTALTATRTIDRIRDPSLALWTSGIRVVRTPTLEPLPDWHKGWRRTALQVVRRITQVAILPDPSVLWCIVALPLGLSLIRHGRPDVILATGGPFSTFLMAGVLGRIAQVPVVLDYRDEWSTHPTRRVATRARVRLRYAIEAIMERWALNQAARVVTVTEGMGMELARRWPRVQGKLRVVGNGYEMSLGRPTRPTHPLTFTFAGKLYPALAAKAFLWKLDVALDAEGMDAVVRFIGESDIACRDEIQSVPWRRVSVQFMGQLPYEETLRLLGSGGVNMVLIDNIPGYQRYHSQKFYDYVGVGQPMVVVGPDGSELAGIIDRYGLGWFVPHSASPEVMVQLVRDLRRLLSPEGWAAFQLGRRDVSLLHRRYQTEVLAQVLLEAAGVPSSNPRPYGPRASRGYGECASPPMLSRD